MSVFSVVAPLATGAHSFSLSSSKEWQDGLLNYVVKTILAASLVYIDRIIELK